MAATQEQVFEDDFPLVKSCPVLNELRLSEEIEDLIINVKGNRRVHAHRVILAARIPSLRRILSGQRTPENTELIWPTVPFNLVSNFVEYVYTGKVCMTPVTVRGMAGIGKMFDLPDLVNWGVTFMTNSLNLDNLAAIWDCAQALKIHTLTTACIDLMKTRFEDIICSDLLLRLPAEVMLALLRDDCLAIASEEAAFAAISCWVGPGSEDCNERLKMHAPAMLKEVRWLQTSLEFRSRLMAGHPIFDESKDCLRLLGKIEQWMQNRNNADCPFNRNRRLSVQKIFVFGKDYKMQRWSVLGYNSHLQDEERISDMDGTYADYANYIVIEDSIFMVGGRDDSGNASPRVCEFLPRERRWQVRAPLNVARFWHAAVVLQTGDDNKATLLCVFGGFSRTNGGSLSSCEVYNATKDRWFRLPDMQEARRGPAAACVPGDSRVFVFGGATTNSAGSELASVVYCQLGSGWQERLSTASSAEFWIQAAPVRMARDGLAATAFRGCILVAGGWDNNNRNLSLVESFRLPDANSPRGQWTELAPMKQPRRYFTLLVCGDTVIALGDRSRGSENTVEALIPPDDAAASANDLTSWTWSSKTPIETLERIRGAVYFRM